MPHVRQSRCCEKASWRPRRCDGGATAHLLQRDANGSPRRGRRGGRHAEAGPHGRSGGREAPNARVRAGRDCDSLPGWQRRGASRGAAGAKERARGRSGSLAGWGPTAEGAGGGGGRRQVGRSRSGPSDAHRGPQERRRWRGHGRALLEQRQHGIKGRRSRGCPCQRSVGRDVLRRSIRSCCRRRRPRGGRRPGEGAGDVALPVRWRALLCGAISLLLGHFRVLRTPEKAQRRGLQSEARARLRGASAMVGVARGGRAP